MNFMLLKAYNFSVFDFWASIVKNRRENFSGRGLSELRRKWPISRKRKNHPNSFDLLESSESWSIISFDRFVRSDDTGLPQKPRYQFESGTSHSRCLRLAFRERLPRRHVCGKHISSSFSPPIVVSLTLSRSLILSRVCSTRVGTSMRVRPGSTRRQAVLVPRLASMCWRSSDRMWVGR